MTDEELINLLPWYVNGTLSHTEKAAVEGLLARSEEAREEHGFLLKLSKEVASEQVQAPSELGWKRLQRDIRQEQQGSKRQWWKPGLAAAATLMLAVQVGFWVQTDSGSDTRLLSVSDNAMLASDYWVLQVEFVEVSEWQRVTELIDNMEGQIVDGPSSMGLLRIAVPRDNPRFDNPEALMAWLKEQPAIAHVAVEGD